MGSFCTNLRRSLGGRWRYIAGSCGWWCDDGRHVLRCCNGEENHSHREYWLYHPDKTPERAENYLYRPKQQRERSCSVSELKGEA